MSPDHVAVIVGNLIYMRGAVLHWRFWRNEAFPKSAIPCFPLLSGRAGIKLADARLSITSALVGTQCLVRVPFSAVSPNAKCQVGNEAHQQDDYFRFHY